MKFPFLRKQSLSPQRGELCPICKSVKAVSPNSYVSLDGGAFRISRQFGERVGGSSPENEAFLYLHWHGAHDAGEGPFRGVGFLVPIASEVTDGQFSLQFCSTTCLRSFLNQCVDEVDRRLQESTAETSSDS